ncbi:MAG: hypothetical protein M3O30_17660 [Planctomycetota bacterium]|nr:hypothetical protein [Planctomycetota bacterium]
MTERDSNYEHFHELAVLPPGDPARQQLEVEIEAMEPADRDYWFNVLRGNDLLRNRLLQVTVPPGLEEMLLRVPREHQADLSPDALRLHSRKASIWKKVTRPLGWGRIAALLLIGTSVITYALWPAPARPKLEALSDSIAERITQQAVLFHRISTVPEVDSEDPKIVEAALSAQNLPFPVMVLNPTAKLNLRGGGVCYFEGSAAAYTQWQGDGAKYTVFQFDGKKLGAPNHFLPAVEMRKELWRDDLHYRVVIWPDVKAQCTWAVVMESEAVPDVFICGYSSF